MAEKLIKTSISVDGKLLDWIDKQIEKRVYRNRSHAFDVAGFMLKENVEASSPKKAAIEIAA